MTAPTVTPAEQSRQLVARFQNGDAGAFGEIYRQHRDAVFAVLYSRCHDRPLAEDLTQDTFVRAWGGLARWEWQGKSVLAFLVTIAGRLLLDHRTCLRERMTTSNPAALDYAFYTLADDSPDGHPDEQAIARTFSADLTAALRSLTGDQRRCLWLRHVAGLSVEQTAAEMGRTKPGITQLTFRATRSAARQLREVGHG